MGLYLSGDREALALAEQLFEVQECNGALLSKQLAKEAEQLLVSMHEATAASSPLATYDGWLHAVFKSKNSSEEAERAKATMTDLQDRLGRLAQTRP